MDVQRRRMYEATVIAPLVTRNLLADLDTLLAPRTPASKARIVPIVLEPCPIDWSELARYDPIPTNGYADSRDRRAAAAAELVRTVQSTGRHDDAAPRQGIDDAERFAHVMLGALDRQALRDTLLRDVGAYLEHVTTAGPLRSQLVELHGWLHDKGMLNRFVCAARTRNPEDPALLAFCSLDPFEDGMRTKRRYRDDIEELESMCGYID